MWGCRTRRKPILRLDGAIHGANGPAAPHRPTSDRFPLLWVGVDLVDTVDPRHAWMLFVQSSKYSISMKIHPRMAWIYDRSQETVEGGVGPVAGREPHGPEACLGRVGQDAQPRSCRVRRKAHTSKRLPSLDGRTCSAPGNRTHPPSLGMRLLFSLLLARWPLQAPGAARPNTPTGSRRPEQVPYAAIRQPT